MQKIFSQAQKSLAFRNLFNKSFKNPTIVATNEQVEPVREEYKEMAVEFGEFMKYLTPRIKQHYHENGQPLTTKIVNYAKPQEIKEAFGSFNQEAGSFEDCIKDIEKNIPLYMRTNHPYFNDKLYHGSDPIGQAAELVVSVLNTAVHVYHVSPVFSVLETECGKLFAEKFGFNKETSEGVLNPGGTMSNMMALLVARNERFPHVRDEGWKPEDQPVSYTSIQSHYSNARGAMIAGMGLNNCRKIKCDRMTGQMIPEEFEAQVKRDIAAGKTPFFVNSTGGSTVMGSYDDFEAIHAICKKYNIWMHIDGCWGGSLAWGNTSKHLFKGCEKADSISINAHKGFGVPNQCAYLLTNNHMGALRAANTSNADYLFHKEYLNYDLGDMTLACGRKPDALKLWLSLKRHGITGFENMADRAYQKAIYLTKSIKAQPEKFTMVNEPMGTNVCFWYIPPAFRNQEYTDDQKVWVHKKRFERMHDANIIIQQQPLADHNLPNFWRMTLKSDKTTLADMDQMLNEVERLGIDLTPEMVC